MMLTRAWYGEWFPKLKSRIEDREWTVPQDEYIFGDFGAVRMKAGFPLIDDAARGERGSSAVSRRRHGDGAVAAVLSLYAVMECAGDAPPWAQVSESGSAGIWAGYGG